MADYIISREDFLVGRMLALKTQQQPERNWLHTERSAVVSPVLRPSTPPGFRPPPGLEAPPGLELPESIGSEASDDHSETCSMSEEKPAVKLPVPEAEQYKVLLQNLPEAMLKECMLRVMLEQAKLSDVTDLLFAQKNAVITFASLASVGLCINHFQGRQWGSSKAPVWAIRVRAQKAPAPSAKVSADAPEFVPGSLWTSRKFSADAPVFVPSFDKFARDRNFSNASTDVGSTSDEKWSTSDGCDSETEVQAVCT